MSNQKSYTHWPFLSQVEFELACTHLEHKYQKAIQEKARLTFKICCRRIASSELSYVEVLRLLQPPEDINDLSNTLERLCIFENVFHDSGPTVDCINEEDDKEALCLSDSPPQYSFHPHQPYIIYEIHLHPTYRTPTLWFTLHDLKPKENALDIENVYRYLVPPERQSSLRSAGIAGGLSVAPHPVTDIPAFFIHPCQTKEAMEGFDCDIADYLMIWIGIVGGSVGLWFPPEMAQVKE